MNGWIDDQIDEQVEDYQDEQIDGLVDDEVAGDGQDDDLVGVQVAGLGQALFLNMAVYIHILATILISFLYFTERNIQKIY